MRFLIWTAAVASAAFMLGGTQQANADPYRWCAEYGGQEGGGTNCGFVTLEQCRITIMGMGGWCVPNQFYDGRPYDQGQPVRRRNAS
jgi:Protein of unknown function (DUF3551)